MVAFAILLAAIPSVIGHGFLREPAARNFVANKEVREFCPHCLQGGGPPTVSGRAGGHWPSVERPESHGLCGDPGQGIPVENNWRDETYLVPTPLQRSYAPGETVEFSVEVRAHHMGHFEFRICDQALEGQTLNSRADGQACLNKWILERAPPRSICQAGDSDPDCAPVDKKHPGRWYMPPAKGGTELYKMRYQIPVGLQCNHCTLQWYWSTANSCLYDADYHEYALQLQDGGWTAQWFSPLASTCGPAYGEEFWNCADISVGSGGSPRPTLSPSRTPSPLATTVAPTTAPTPQPKSAPQPTPKSAPQPTPIPLTTFAPQPAPSPQPTPPSNECQALWGKCGGQGWTGPACCQPGDVCNRQSVWYSQCIPGAALVSEQAQEATPATLRGRRAVQRHHTMALVELDSQLSQVNQPYDEDDADVSVEL